MIYIVTGQEENRRLSKNKKRREKGKKKREKDEKKSIYR